MRRQADLKKVGLLGGTFDPVHNGHLAVAGHVHHKLGLDSIRFIPAPSPPHKSTHEDGQPITSFQKRLAMLERATAGNPAFVVSAIEAKRSAPSYTIDTLHELRAKTAAQTRFFFVMGSDAFAEIFTWKQYDRLPDYAALVIISRADSDPRITEETIRKYFPEFHPDPRPNTWSSENHQGLLLEIHMQPVPISSTMVRERVRKNLDISGLVPAGVAEYIRTRNLYGSLPPNSG